MHELINRRPGVEGLLERIEGEVAAQRAGHAPADDPPGKDIDDEGHIDEAAPGGDVGEVSHPQLVGTGRHELSVDEVRRARRAIISNRGLERAPADGALQPHLSHQALHRAACDRDAFRNSCRQILRAP